MAYRGYINPGPGYTCPCIDQVIEAVQEAEKLADRLEQSEEPMPHADVKEVGKEIGSALYDLEDRMEAIREANTDLRDQRDKVQDELDEVKEELDSERDELIEANKEINRLEQRVQELEEELEEMKEVE